MLGPLWLIPVFPLLGFVVLALFGKAVPQRTVSAVGVGSVGLAAAAAAWVSTFFVVAPPSERAFTQILWTWIDAGRFRAAVGFRLDPVSVVMILVVTFVGL